MRDRRVLVVGNQPPTPGRDLSEFIDAYDVVVRVSKCDYIDSGLIGTKTDIVYLEPNVCWAMNTHQQRHRDILSSCKDVRVKRSWYNRALDRLTAEGYVTTETCFPVDGYDNEQYTSVAACLDLSKREDRVDTIMNGWLAKCKKLPVVRVNLVTNRIRAFDEDAKRIVFDFN
ncbi:MAG: hypothetical protein RR382_00390 [Tannerellaceae bacterium]